MIPAAVSTTSAPVGGESPPSFESLLSLGLYAGITVFLVAVLLLLAWGLGHKTRSSTKDESYESGIIPTGLARLHEPVPFYLVAIFFIVFDEQYADQIFCRCHRGLTGFSVVVAGMGVSGVFLLFLP